MELTRHAVNLVLPHQSRQRSVAPALTRHSARAVRASAPERRALGLGWLSIGIGLTQLVAPGPVARWIGVDDDDALTRATLMGVGVRELTCGVGLLSKARPATWAWLRFAGDVLDLALLGTAWRSAPGSRVQMLGAAAAVLGVACVDAQTAVTLGRAQHAPLAAGVAVREAVTVQGTADEAYTFFRQLENLPTFMSHLESVVEAGTRSRWRAKGPLGVNVEWDAELVEDRPGERLTWRSLPGAVVANRGTVHFRAAPGGLGTEISVELDYEPPLGAVGSTLAQLFGREPSQQVSADLRRLKQMLETGEVLHSDASIHRGRHPARPSSLPQGTSNSVSKPQVRS